MSIQQEITGYMEQSIEKKGNCGKSTEDLWAGKRIFAVLKKGGIPWECVKTSLT